MDDINFDELDQAVNSAMKPQSPADASTDEALQVPTTATESQEQVATTAPTAVAVPTKRRGQFMDMVHPSSDMRKATPSASPIRRQAPSITPLNPSIVETSQDDSTTTSEPENSAGVTAFVEPPANAHAWPDPIDVAAQSSSEVPATSDADMATVENSFVDTMVAVQPAAVEVPEESKENDSEATPLIVENPEVATQSPFVEGAEVEKRPLGAFAAVDAESDLQAETVHDTPSDEDITTESVVADEVPVEPVTEAVDSVEPETAADTGPEAPKDPVNTDSGESGSQAPVDAGAEVGTAQSIPQQYRPDEVAAEPNSNEHAVFDTAEYHQPLPLPEKQHGKHKTVFYLFLAVLMLAVGAAAGYAIFVLKLF